MLDAEGIKDWLFEVGGRGRSDTTLAANQDAALRGDVSVIRRVRRGSGNRLVPCPHCGLTNRRHSFFCQYHQPRE